MSYITERQLKGFFDFFGINPNHLTNHINCIVKEEVEYMLLPFLLSKTTHIIIYEYLYERINDPLLTLHHKNIRDKYDDKTIDDRNKLRKAYNDILFINIKEPVLSLCCKYETMINSKALALLQSYINKVVFCYLYKYKFCSTVIYNMRKELVRPYSLRYESSFHEILKSLFSNSTESFNEPTLTGSKYKKIELTFIYLVDMFLSEYYLHKDEALLFFVGDKTIDTNKYEKFTFFVKDLEEILCIHTQSYKRVSCIYEATYHILDILLTFISEFNVFNEMNSILLRRLMTISNLINNDLEDYYTKEEVDKYFVYKPLEFDRDIKRYLQNQPEMPVKNDEYQMRHIFKMLPEPVPELKSKPDSEPEIAVLPIHYIKKYIDKKPVSKNPLKYRSEPYISDVSKNLINLVNKTLVIEKPKLVRQTNEPVF